MRECPVCKSRYDTSVAACPRDNAALNDIKVTTYLNPDIVKKQQEDALKELERGLKAAALSNDVDQLRAGYIKLADFYREQQQLAQALVYLNKAELLAPGDTETTLLPAILEIHLQQSRTEKALELARRLAILYGRAGQRERAAEYFKRLITLRPSDLTWVRDILSILEESGLVTGAQFSEGQMITGELGDDNQPLTMLAVTNSHVLSVAVSDAEGDDDVLELEDLLESPPLAANANGGAANNSAQETGQAAAAGTQSLPPLPGNGTAAHAASPANTSVSSNSASSVTTGPLATGHTGQMAKPVTGPLPPLTGALKSDTVTRPLGDTGELRPTSQSGEHRILSRVSGSFRITDTAKLSFNDQVVMVVDDDVDVCDLVAEMLSEFGCRVVKAIDGQDAIEKLQDTNPSFIISDIAMPRVDGYGLFEYIQNNEQFSEIPFIFLTGRGEIDVKLNALEGGVEDYWLKPFDVEELSIRVRRMLQKVRLAGDVRGRLSEMPLPDLLQSLASGNKSGVLHLSRSGRAGVIYIDQGRIIDAEFEDLTGKNAIYCLVNWCMEGGNFNFHSQKIDRDVVIKQSIQGILMEAMRRRDEENRLIEQLPPGDVFMAVNTEDNPDFFSADFSDETMRIIQLFDGTHSLKECINCLKGDLETIQTVVALNKAGLLRIVDFGIQ